MWRAIFLFLLTFPVSGQTAHPILPLGSSAPDFSLPGVDGKIHRLADYAGSPVLVVIFTCNHCPIAQMYEQRIQRLEADYKSRGVAVVAIQPNDPKALRIDELDSSDISDTLDEMKIRVAYKNLHYTYLYDGETQSVARAYGPQATPHVFIFDKERKLRYEGRMDNSYRKELVNSQDARNAIDAFVLHDLEAQNLTPNKEAEKNILLRRLSLDLIGLPPTLKELDAFLKDKSPKAFERQVDRLLKSPHFGERMAVPWLDLARHSDTGGYHNDSFRTTWMWRCISKHCA